MASRFFILSGPVGSGKTSTLMKWCRDKKEMRGLLTPVIQGKRFFVDMENGSRRPMEAEPGEDFISVGRYHFSREGFRWANERLAAALPSAKNWLVIDEVGPLELKGQGYHTILEELLQKDTPGNILLVVRDTLLKEMILFYGLDKKGYELVDTSSSIFE